MEMLFIFPIATPGGLSQKQHSSLSRKKQKNKKKKHSNTQGLVACSLADGLWVPKVFCGLLGMDGVWVESSWSW